MNPPQRWTRVIATDPLVVKPMSTTSLYVRNLIKNREINITHHVVLQEVVSFNNDWACA